MPQTIWIVLISLLAIFLAGGYYFSRVANHPHTHTYEEVYQSKLELGEFDPTEWDSWEKEEVWITSPYGYPLHGYWLPVTNARGTVVLVHGITVNINASIKYVKPFRSRGFNIMMYDHRNHGKSGGTVTTFGFYEKYDLKKVVDWVIEKMGEEGMVGTHGESMGAGTVLQHAAIDDRLAFVVEDCGYADLMKLFRYRVHADYHIPGWIVLPVGSMMSKLTAGYAFSQVKPVRDIHEVKTPIFFIHGEKDDYIPPSHAQMLYDAKQCGYRKIWFAPDAGHAESEQMHPGEYDRQIGEFLEDIFHE